MQNIAPLAMAGIDFRLFIQYRARTYLHPPESSAGATHERPEESNGPPLSTIWKPRAAERPDNKEHKMRIFI